MKIKGIDRTANIAWSPEHHYPIYLAVGTAAQQLDASFSITASLELYSLNLNDPGYDMGLRSSSQSEHRFHKLTWGTHGQALGTIVGGCDGGVLQIYNAGKLLNGENGLVFQQTKHKGSVRDLDFNSFQNNLLVSAASESEIYIWDLNNPTTPMTPGSKCQPLEDITSVAWNKQVQHILASTFQTKCVVWDLRKNDPIIKLTDNTIRVKWHAVAWNPDIATQLCLGSEDDQNSVIQLWDLRFATSPLKVFNNHEKGVLSISWCHQDTDMLLSCGRDNKVICWNTNNNIPGFDINCEFVLNNQWNFDVSWCPRNPALFACSSFDGHVSIYSLFGSPQQVQTSTKIADSFPGMEFYAQAPVTQTHSVPVEVKKSPKWLKKPVGAKFGFGGKLVTFENITSTSPDTLHSRQVYISQVITEEQLVLKSSQLESALQTKQYTEFCHDKIMQSNSSHEKLLWQFIAANFKTSPKSEFLNLLGFSNEELSKKLANALDKTTNGGLNEISRITNKMSALGRSTDSESEVDLCDITDRQSFLLENDLLSNEQHVTTSVDDATSVKTSLRGFKISVGNDFDGLICEALLLGNIEAAVDLCLQDNRMADAIVLAMTGGSELLAKTQYVYFQQNPGYLTHLISAVVTEDWSQLIKTCTVDSWKEALAAAITYANEQEFAVLCEMLGERLENDENESLSKNAELCYICAGNLSKVVSSWLRRDKAVTPDNLQELVDLTMMLKKSMELQGAHVEISGRLASLFATYAGILISQGSTEAALSYLGDSNDESILELKDRLNGSLGKNYKNMQPFKKQASSQPQAQRIRAISAGFYSSSLVQDDVVTAPPISQHNFNLNPLQSNATSATNNFSSTPYVPVPSMAPGSVMPPPQQAAPPSNRVFPCPSPGPGGLTSRAKHVLDPSVQSATSHSSYYSQNQYQPPIYAPQLPLPNQTYGLNNKGYSTDVFKPPQSNPTPPPPPQANVSKPFFTPQPPGWNDPPIVNASKSFSRGSLCETSAEHAGTRKWKSVMLKSSQPKTDFVPQSPITQPLLGGPTGDMAANGQFYDQNSNQQIQQNLKLLPNQFQSAQQLPYPQFPASNMPQPLLPKEGVQKPIIAEPMKKPIPEEHVALQNVFDELRNRCTLAANNPQSKRKLEEVSKKLEVLYDGLREGRLSANTLQGLHLIVQHVQTGEYTNGLMLHTQLVSGPDFSQIAGFMPGIKVLLQSALQLQVYL